MIVASFEGEPLHSDAEVLELLLSRENFLRITSLRRKSHVKIRRK